jgi:DNA-binding NarL/FixJ family response regulator
LTRIAAYVPDLMDRSKVAAAGGAEVTFVRSAADLAAAGADLVVVDLARPGVLEVLRQLGGTRSVGFASHVDRELIEAAREAGCDRVLARSQFFGSLPELLA